MEKQKLLSISEVAKRLGVSQSTIRNWHRKKILRALQPFKGAWRRFSEEEVEKLNQTRTVAN
jgi:excisionase family DNA binding protein